MRPRSERANWRSTTWISDCTSIWFFRAKSMKRLVRASSSSSGSPTTLNMQTMKLAQYPACVGSPDSSAA